MSPWYLAAALHCKKRNFWLFTFLIFSTLLQLILLWNFVNTDKNHETNFMKENPVPVEHNTREEDNFLPRILAIVFPQFHQDPLNDLIWGEGFTDWNNLNATPQLNRGGFPIIRPTELGYYDYAQAEPRRSQGILAKEHGIDGFVFHHYWFYDKSHPGPTLGRPLENMLQDGYPNISFCLHWCSSKWINTWSGANVNPNFTYPKKNTMQQQFYPETDEQAIDHYNWLRQFFHHPNYIKVNGKPVFMVYEKKPSSIPVLQKFQELARNDGFPGLYLTVGLMRPHPHLINTVVDPNSERARSNQGSGSVKGVNVFDKVLDYPKPLEWNRNGLEVPSWCGRRNTTDRVEDIVGILAAFDNTPRRTVDDAVLWSSDPKTVVNRFQTSLRAALYYEACCFDDATTRQQRTKHDDDRFVVINAMNEWAEGMAIEPSNVYGRNFLKAILQTKQKLLKERCRAKETA